ncbi:ATPase AAA [Dehalococcoides mccartyi]|uniref:ATPase AAA n=1 Tax=Dehalococcoides mccartyi TaxID=61435 RepID=A0A0V8M0G3_9CHLR|nr:ATP-binding protein [Dehalococcoides mccartyi]KSV17247.1 ATPase AAA [Dehalococcoides mccartyi]
MKASDIDILKEIARFEATVAESEYPLGWCWRQVRVWPSTLNKLVIEGLLEVTFSSNSYTGYRLTEKGKTIASGDPLTEQRQITVEAPEIPDDLFALIEGYDDIKDLVCQVLGADKPVHLLFTGVPSSAKTMFLMELAQIPSAVYILGSQATRAGIAETLFDLNPAILLVDEIDRIGTRDIAILLSLAETGIVVETKHARRREIRLNTKIFAASNTLNMPRELISRFMVLTFKPYLKEEFLKVACTILVSREQVDPDLALYIAQKVYQLSPSPDPRQVVRVARLAKSADEVDKVLDIITRYTS